MDLGFKPGWEAQSIPAIISDPILYVFCILCLFWKRNTAASLKWKDK